MQESNQQAFDWEDLLTLIDRGRLVPVVGKELLVVDGANGPRGLEFCIVDDLINGLGLNREEFPQDCTLNEFSTRHLKSFPSDKRENSKWRIQKRIAEVVAGTNYPVPESLTKLAEITQLDLFISTTPYNLLEQALNNIRKNGCSSRVYNLRDTIKDIPDESMRRDIPCVFNLFGSASGDDRSLDFAVTDEDMIEYLHRFNEQNAQFSTLSGELKQKNLLLLGSGLPDGLIRFLIRSLSNKRLFPSKNYKVVDGRAAQDPNLLLFLRGFTNHIFLSEDAVGFVDELHRQWQGQGHFVAHGTSADDNQEAASDRQSHSRPASERPGIFISYKHEDKDAVKRLVAALEQVGLPIWWDSKSIQGGDDWLREVRKNVNKCLLFVPVISRNAQTDESEATREWNLAKIRAERMSEDTDFIIPVRIDDIEPGAKHIPALFWEKSYITCPKGEPSPEFSSTILMKFREREVQRKAGST